MKHVIVGTAGHIDHGKTALVKALTGIDADRLKEEKQRGITIDIGFADLAVGDFRFGFVDVPGHERFVKNMLAGAHGLDIVMLVVAADESIMPQTREHFDICRLLHVKSGLVALTKTDLVDSDLLELARAEIEEYTTGSFLEGAPIIPVSSRTGQGIAELKEALVSLAQSTQPKKLSAVPRLPVDRAFSIRGFGTVVTGTLIAGEVAVGEEVAILPPGIRTRVRNLQVHGHDTDRALAGQRTAVNLQGINVDQVPRGSVLSAAGRVRPTSMIDARLELLPSAARPLAQRARVRLHHGTAEVMARVLILGSSVNDADASQYGESPDDHRQGGSRQLRPGRTQIVQLRLEQPVAALPGDRFIIRSYSPQVTIGGGVIIDALPEKHRLKDGSVREQLERLENASDAEMAAMFIEMAGRRAMLNEDLAARTGATDEQLNQISQRLIGSGRALEVGGSTPMLISASAYEALASELISLLEQHHRLEPLSVGAGREEIRERLLGAARPEIFRMLVTRLSEDRKVVADRDTLRLASHKPELSTKEASAKNALEMAIRSSGLQAGTIEEAAASAGVQTELARKLYTLLSAERRVIKIGDFVFHAEAITDLKSRVTARKSISNRMDVTAFKEITGGLTRKFAIPLLEYLDRERVTRRVGNEREIL